MTPDEVLASYREAMDACCGVFAIRRYTGAGVNRPRFDVDVRGRVTGYQPNELVGSVQQGDRKVIVLVEDLITAQFPLPITANDKLILLGKELAIVSVDSSTRRVQGVLIAYELQVRG